MAGLEITRLSTRMGDFDARLEALLDRRVVENEAVLDTVRNVIRRVREEGDPAVIELARLHDGLSATSLDAAMLGPADFEAAWERIAVAEREALTASAARIRAYHEHQVQDSWYFTDELGNRLGQRVTPLERVGVYVPGGQASYPSTVLMTVVPARVAGVGEVLMTVPAPQGTPADLVLAAAHVAGVDRAWMIGGAQAIAALAVGTESIPRVDKIVGPGGAYVAAAKRLVFGEVGIDMVAGPSEVLIVADGSSPPEWVALDLFSQAEHDALAQALLLSPEPSYLEAVQRSMAEHLPSQPRAALIAESLRRRGGLIETRDLAEAIRIANRVAPEHLQLCVLDPDTWLEEVRNAGAVFLGAHSPEVLGDYSAGPSHVLPTYGSARFSSPLGVYDFQKKSSVIHLSRNGSEPLARAAATLAHGEGLTAHARAAELRLLDRDRNR